MTGYNQSCSRTYLGHFFCLCHNVAGGLFLFTFIYFLTYWFFCALSRTPSLFVCRFSFQTPPVCWFLSYAESVFHFHTKHSLSARWSFIFVDACWHCCTLCELPGYFPVLVIVVSVIMPEKRFSLQSLSTHEYCSNTNVDELFKHSPCKSIVDFVKKYKFLW